MTTTNLDFKNEELKELINRIVNRYAELYQHGTGDQFTASVLSGLREKITACYINDLVSLEWLVIAPKIIFIQDVLAIFKANSTSEVDHLYCAPSQTQLIKGKMLPILCNALTLLSQLDKPWVKDVGWNNKTYSQSTELLEKETHGDTADTESALGSELADQLLRTLNIAAGLNINIGDEVLKKLQQAQSEAA